MGIYLGSSEVSDFKLGSSQVSFIYSGMTKLWPTVNSRWDGLVFGFPFNEASGTIAYNVITTYSNGTSTNVTPNVTGKLGTAYQFSNASASDVAIGATVPANTNTLTLSAWIYPTASGSYFGIQGNWGFTGGDISWQIDAPSSRFRFDIEGGVNPAFSTSAISINTWTLITTTYDAGVVIHYINGSSNGGGTGSNVTAHFSDWHIGTAYSIGRSFSGTIDQALVWNRVLTSTEVGDLYNGGSGVAYPF